MGNTKAWQLTSLRRSCIVNANQSLALSEHLVNACVELGNEVVCWDRAFLVLTCKYLYVREPEATVTTTRPSLVMHPRGINRILYFLLSRPCITSR